MPTATDTRDRVKTFRVSRDEEIKLELLARAQRVSTSELLRDLVRRAIDDAVGGQRRTA